MALGAAKGVFNALDHMLYKALIACLKSEDYQAASIAIEQLEKEKKDISIPPLYFVAQAHPNERVRARAKQALATFKKEKEIEALTRDKDLKESVKAMIEHFGNYRQ